MRLRYNADMLDISPAPVYNVDTKFIVPICQNCKHWRAEADGEAGICTSPLFADAVWAHWDSGSPLMTVPTFVCGYFEDRE